MYTNENTPSVTLEPGGSRGGATISFRRSTRLCYEFQVFTEQRASPYPDTTFNDEAHGNVRIKVCSLPEWPSCPWIVLPGTLVSVWHCVGSDRW
jgi:hypothetical protein